MSKSKKVEQKIEDKKKCYKFVTNVQMWNDLFKKWECIKLTEAELPKFQQYVTVCHGEKESNKPCNC